MKSEDSCLRMIPSKLDSLIRTELDQDRVYVSARSEVVSARSLQESKSSDETTGSYYLWLIYVET